MRTPKELLEDIVADCLELSKHDEIKDDINKQMKIMMVIAFVDNIVGEKGE